MAQTDLDCLQGTWTIVSLEIAGSSMPAGMFANARVRVQGDRFESLGMGMVYEGAVTLTEASAPKQFDLRFTAGPESGNVNQGIYQLDGDDWTLCLDMSGQSRPDAFSTGGGSRRALQVLRREKAAETAVPARPTGELIPEFEGEWEMTSAWISGQKLPSSFTMRRVVKGDRVVVTMSGKTVLEAAYAADRASNPKTMDFVLRDGGLQHGIWEFDGPVLRTCLGAVGQPRPAGFTPERDGRILTEWRRVKQGG